MMLIDVIDRLSLEKTPALFTAQTMSDFRAKKLSLNSSR
jgi:hypothetical protein